MVGIVFNLPYGVTGNTLDFGSDIMGSNPVGATLTNKTKHNEQSLFYK